jgi:hypothetical protein
LQIVDSRLIETREELKFIEGMFEKRKIKLEKLYTASVDGFNGEKYHAKCNDKSNILTVLESELGKKFGGFTSVEFDSTNKWYSDSKAFVFSLSNRKKHVLINQNETYAFSPSPN